MEPRGYAIFGTPRCGTNHLCSLLASTGQLGKPYEYLNQAALDRLSPPVSLASLRWDGMVNLSRSDNGVFAIKAFFHQIEAFADIDFRSRLLGLPAIFLSRRDRLGQAISWARAMQTGQYTANGREERRPQYDFQQIRETLASILFQEASFNHTFIMYKMEPLRLIYEDYIKDEQGTVDKIADLVGVKRATIAAGAGLAVQRDALSEEWRDRFCSERPDRGQLFDVSNQDGWSQLGQRLMPLRLFWSRFKKRWSGKPDRP